MASSSMTKSVRLSSLLSKYSKEIYKLVFPCWKVVFGVDRGIPKRLTLPHTFAGAFILGFHLHTYEFGACAFLCNLIHCCLFCELPYTAAPHVPFLSPELPAQCLCTCFSLCLEWWFPTALPSCLSFTIQASAPRSPAPKELCWWPRAVPPPPSSLSCYQASLCTEHLPVY